MKLQVERVQQDADVTIGRLLVDGVFECWTLEDPVREKPGVPVEQWKIKGETAIPRGTYRVLVTMSDRFKRLMPLLENVLGFVGVRIHSGNTTANTEGCLLVGDVRLDKSIGQSRVAFDRLYEKIYAAFTRGESVTLEVA